ncbi:MAG: alkaline phosphatase D family protein [Candidatus Binatia bacterium]
MAMWIVPGAPLAAGAGWRIWYSRPGHGDFRPEPVQVFRSEKQEETESQEWNLLPDLAGLDRRMGILTLKLATPKPGALYEIQLPEVSSSEPFRWRSLPDSIEPEGFSFMFASCFWRPNDKEGHYAEAVKALHKLHPFAFKLLIGDQVYCDWPADYTPDFGAQSEVKLCADRYREYWGDEKYREMMGTSPNFFTCDDHEFWNDYPERQMHLTRSWEKYREPYSQAAQALYDRYQKQNNPEGKPWYRFTIKPVSFFVTDTRSQRDFHREDGKAHFMPEEEWAELELWVKQLQGPGVLVLGQPIFQKDGDWKDRSLSNFVDDYSRLWHVIEDSLRGNNDENKPHDILVLSGDIHTGRHAMGQREDMAVHELIASPACMISPGGSEPTEPDYKFTVGRGQDRRTWSVKTDPFMTRDDQVGAVRIRPGTNGRVAFDLGLWQIRPVDDRRWWEKTIGAERQEGRFRFMYQKEIQLR